jgi:hypothetical protein
LPSLRNERDFGVKAMPSNIEPKSVVLDCPRQPSNDGILFQNNARNAQIRKLIGSGKPSWAGAEYDYTIAVTARF